MKNPDITIKFTQKEVDVLVAMFGYISGCPTYSLRSTANSIRNKVSEYATEDGIMYAKERIDCDGSIIKFNVQDNKPKGW